MILGISVILIMKIVGNEIDEKNGNHWHDVGGEVYTHSMFHVQMCIDVCKYRTYHMDIFTMYIYIYIK